MLSRKLAGSSSETALNVNSSARSLRAIPQQLNRIVWVAFLLAAFASILSVPVFAQQAATVTGSLTDPSKAAVPGATMTLTNQNTGVVEGTQKTDASGNFSFVEVPAPATYTLSVQVAGFSKYEQTGIIVVEGERRSVGAIALTVGATTSEVTVTADVTPVQTASMEKSTNIDSNEIAALLSLGVNWSGYVRIIPGIPGLADPTGPSSEPTVQVNGLRGSATIPTLDGADGSDPSSQGSLYATEAADALQEVNVKTSNYQAEYGQSGGAIISLTTKAGTKTFHGDFYGYLRNEDLNANNFFNNKNNVHIAKYRYNIDGGSIGGPVYIPKKWNTNRTKIFFFFNDEFAAQGIPGSLNELTFPTPLELAGNFSQTVTTGCALIPVTAPGSKTPYPGNIVPASAINPLGLDLLSVFSYRYGQPYAPNFPDPCGSANRSVTGGNYNNIFQETPVAHIINYTYRADFNLSDKMHLYGHDNQVDNKNTGVSVGASPGPTNWNMIQAFYKSRIETPTINLIYDFSPTVINEFTFGVNHWDEPGGPLNSTYNSYLQRTYYNAGGVNLNTLGQWYPQANSNDVIPIMSFGGSPGVPSPAAYSYDARAPIDGATTKFLIRDDITKVWGKHTFKTGVSIERVRMWKGNPGTAYSGNFSFSADTANPVNTGYPYADAIQGVFDSYTESSARNAADYREASFEEYVQDSWHVTSRLTLELGVRFTTRIPWHQRQGIMAGFNPDAWVASQTPELYQPEINAAGTRVAFNPQTGAQLPAIYIGAVVPGYGNPIDGMLVVGQPGVPKSLTNGQHLATGPRLGFAYDVFGDGKTALRGGFSVSFIPTSDPSLCCSNSYQSNPPLSNTPTTYYGSLNTFTQSVGTLFPQSVLGLMEPKLGQSYSFSLGVQHDIGYHFVADVAFVGTEGRDLLQSRNLNTLPYGYQFLASSQDPTTTPNAAQATLTCAGCQNYHPLASTFLYPYVGYNGITFREPTGSSNYYSLQTQLNRRLFKGFDMKMNWTWSKSMDYSSSEGGAFPIYASRYLLDYGLSSFDKTFVTNIAFQYELPGSKKFTGVITGALLAHWNVSGITTMASGTPSTASQSFTSGINDIGGGDGQRITESCNPQLGYGSRSGSEWFNTSCFAPTPIGNIGNANGRYMFRGPGTNQTDLAIFKNIKVVGERSSFQIRGEMYNSVNHTQWTSINASASYNPAGGQTNSLFGTATAAASPRIIQMALRFTY